MKVIWTNPALRHLSEILRYLSERNPRAARKAARAIRSAANDLGRFPRKGRPGRIGGTRELVPIGTPYVIGYRIGDRIEILAVQHGAQEWPTEFEPSKPG